MSVYFFLNRRIHKPAEQILSAGGISNAVDLGNSERIRSAKILFLRLRIRLVPNQIYMAKIRSAKILFLRLRKNIFRTPEKLLPQAMNMPLLNSIIRLLTGFGQKARPTELTPNRMTDCPAGSHQIRSENLIIE
ncbi:Uncharacterized protein dnm_003960 [Desulfonema magnum]|uniref:Uncharacterized protein n=1 Tax=Desulfonema magnum TaxID=45655 RepID=A0A975BG13_9BACT|nr:Uncharacterized protein dnm_003960 [Desulfonema magnum]